MNSSFGFDVVGVVAPVLGGTGVVGGAGAVVVGAERALVSAVLTDGAVDVDVVPGIDFAVVPGTAGESLVPATMAVVAPCAPDSTADRVSGTVTVLLVAGAGGPLTVVAPDRPVGVSVCCAVEELASASAVSGAPAAASTRRYSNACHAMGPATAEVTAIEQTNAVNSRNVCPPATSWRNDHGIGGLKDVTEGAEEGKASTPIRAGGREGAGSGWSGGYKWVTRTRRHRTRALSARYCCCFRDIPVWVEFPRGWTVRAGSRGVLLLRRTGRGLLRRPRRPR